ncbi:glycogen/starch synthase, partial [Candidatus Woesearchaeota archaeon]|nr:glycogen/starch synthase [Candidatus Woesearchaeota archaeon]
MENPKAEFLFEVSWEICNKVGGIHTVVKSKVHPILNYYGEKYFVIGPYFVDKASDEFQELLPPPQLKEIFKTLSQEGIYCHYGTWIVPGEPKAILVDYSNYQKEGNRIKGELWQNFQIDSLNSSFHDFDQPIIWAYAVGRLLQLIVEFGGAKVVAQFHEWLSGAALLYLKSRNVRIATVFTTHATMLGRTMTGNNLELYSVINKIDPNEEAYKLGIQSKHQMETQCAQNADVFTTVSEITGIEAEALLKKKPDVLLPNGLNLEKFPTIEEITIKHRQLRDKMHEFIMYYFFPYYKFDLDEAFFYFIAGRYEFHDKGIDLFIDALGSLNERLKKEESNKTVIAFFWIPANFRGIK